MLQWICLLAKSSRWIVIGHASTFEMLILRQDFNGDSSNCWFDSTCDHCGGIGE
jgi:hypothetical protein